MEECVVALDCFVSLWSKHAKHNPTIFHADRVCWSRTFGTYSLQCWIAMLQYQKPALTLKVVQLCLQALMLFFSVRTDRRPFCLDWKATVGVDTVARVRLKYERWKYYSPILTTFITWEVEPDFITVIWWSSISSSSFWWITGFLHF